MSEYNIPEFAQNLIGKSVHITTGCFGIDVSGTIERYDIYRGEIIYILKADPGGRLHIGANSPNLAINEIDKN